jgi:hypothetical protein
METFWGQGCVWIAVGGGDYRVDDHFIFVFNFRARREFANSYQVDFS